MIRVVVLCMVVGCTYPEKVFEGPFTCLGAPQPTTAAPLVKIGGRTSDPSNLTPIAGVTVVLQNVQMSPIFTTTSDAMGSFNFALNTNGTPVGGLDVFASATGKVSTYFYPSRKVTEDLTINIAVLSMQEASNLALGAGLTLMPGAGSVLLTINDCNNMPISGATLTSSPGGTVRYFNGINPSMTATATDTGGVVLVANLPVGKATLTANVMGMVLPPHDYTVVADTFIQTEIQP